MPKINKNNYVMIKDCIFLHFNMSYTEEELNALFEEAEISKNPYVLGYAHGAKDFMTYNSTSDVLAAFISLKHKLPASQVWKFAEGYADGGDIPKGPKRNKEFMKIKKWIETRQQNDRVRYASDTRSELEKLANHFYNLTCASSYPLNPDEVSIKYKSELEKIRNEEDELKNQKPHRKLLHRLDLDTDEINPEEIHPDHEMFQPEPAVQEGEESGDPDWHSRDDRILTDEGDRTKRLEERTQRPKYNQNGYYED